MQTNDDVTNLLKNNEIGKIDEIIAKKSIDISTLINQAINLGNLKILKHLFLKTEISKGKAEQLIINAIFKDPSRDPEKMIELFEQEKINKSLALKLSIGISNEPGEFKLSIFKSLFKDYPDKSIEFLSALTNRAIDLGENKIAYFLLEQGVSVDLLNADGTSIFI